MATDDPTAAARTAPAPDFGRSMIEVAPAAPREGDVVRYDVTLRNTGAADAEHAQLAVELPGEGMYVDGPELAGALVVVDVAAKRVEASVTLPAGGEQRFAFRIVVPRDAGGRVLSPKVSLQDYHSGVSHYGGTTTEIGTRLATDGVSAGAVRVTPAGLIVLGFLAALALAWIVVRKLGNGARGAVFAIVLAIGFWTMFAGMARRDWESLSWPETLCTVLDRRLDFETTTGARSGPAPNTSASRTSTSAQPLLALRYEMNGREIISTGFDTGSRLQIGGAARAATRFREWTIGAHIPCWFSPRDPGDVVVMRGFGGAYLFALVPLPVFVLGVLGLRRSLGRPPSD